MHAIKLPKAKSPGHPWATTSHISFKFYSQKPSGSTFGYDYFVSLPPSYALDTSRRWPLILSLHGAGDSQRGAGESYASIRNGIPKIVLCYDRLKDGIDPPYVEIPAAPRMRRAGHGGGGSGEPVDEEVCSLVAEEFVTLTPSMNMSVYKILERTAGRKLPELRKNLFGYGWNTSVLSELLDEVTTYWRIDLDRIHVTGFSMGGYGTWALAMHNPERFASLTPMAGGGDLAQAGSIAHVSHWIHHGVLDDIVPFEESLKMSDSLEGAGCSNVVFTQYSELKHDCWTNAYNNIQMYRWMLEQRKKPRHAGKS